VAAVAVAVQAVAAVADVDKTLL